MPQPSPAFDAFTTLVAQIASIDIATLEITPETTLAGDLALDSISLISLMALVEERFGISVAGHTEAVADLRTVGDAVQLIDTLAAAHA